MRSRTPTLGLLALSALTLSLAAARAQESPLTGPPNGPRRVDPGWHALVGATVHPEPGRAIEGATVVIRDGKVEAVGEIDPPAGARVWELAGHHVYAGFTDLWVEVDAPRPQKGAPGEYWCEHVTPRRSALDGRGLDEETAKQLRELGFTAAAISPRGGIVRGFGALVSLAEPDPEPGADPPPVYADRVYQALGFRNEGEGYPDSQMGAIALIRQVLFDADWQSRRGSVPGAPRALEVLAPGDAAPPLLMDTADELQAIRAGRIANDTGRRALLLGSGLEFRRLGPIAAARRSIVLPLRFPKKPQVGSVGDAEAVSLRELMTWEQAPTNPHRLDAAGVRVALTTGKIEKRDKFHDHLRKAIRHGLSEERALAMLTTNPSAILRGEGLGRIAPGSIANLQVTDGPLFAKKTRLRWLFVDGKPHEIRPPRLEGTWEVDAVPALSADVALLFDADDGLSVRTGEITSKGKKAEVTARRVSLRFEHEPLGETGMWVLTGRLEGERMRGDGVRPGGERFRWTARLTSRQGPPRKDDEEEASPGAPERYGLPFGGYALDGSPAQPELLVVRGGTLWTCGPAGVIENGVLVVHEGRIVYVGKDEAEVARVLKHLEVSEPTREVDATGRHITPGIIDAHSHTGISGGVNDSGQAVTAEVRIQDVTNPDDVNWYRQLAGGVTTVLSLHGSANPIGGQSQTVKLRWGVARPDEMHFEGAATGIKFALGENVKQSNWGDEHTTRYPQTRMGVETLIRDRFQAAKEYAAARPGGGDHGGRPLRRDLELEALAEVLAGDRLVHCHSYRQDEILMLCRVAQDFGFKIGTFTHVLEGYKVAEAIREHALGASCFSDWWAYKVEVQDAIPENGPIMHDVGVSVSYNSDSSELARRLNVEAAKAVKYGGLSPETALRFVTIHSAVQLRIESRVGSLEVGKDADLAIWSGPPLSTRSLCESTWIDGREYFSLEMDRRHREHIAAERLRLLQKVLASKDDKKQWEEEEEEDYECCEGGGR